MIRYSYLVNVMKSRGIAMLKKIFIRVDANGIIATGHVMRCLSIADALRTLSVEAVFITADEEAS